MSAATCLQADVAAKTALILGSEGPAFLERHGLAARFVPAVGDVLDVAWAA